MKQFGNFFQLYLFAILVTQRLVSGFWFTKRPGSGSGSEMIGSIRSIDSRRLLPQRLNSSLDKTTKKPAKAKAGGGQPRPRILAAGMTPPPLLPLIAKQQLMQQQLRQQQKLQAPPLWSYHGGNQTRVLPLAGKTAAGRSEAKARIRNSQNGGMR